MDLNGVKLIFIKLAQDNYLTQTYPDYAQHITFFIYALYVVMMLYLAYQVVKHLT